MDGEDRRGGGGGKGGQVQESARRHCLQPAREPVGLMFMTRDNVISVRRRWIKVYVRVFTWESLFTGLEDQHLCGAVYNLSMKES